MLKKDMSSPREDFFFLALDVAVCSGGSGANLHFAGWVGRRWWRHEFTGVIFPVVSVTSYRPLLFSSPGSCPAGSFLNPVLVNGAAKWCPCQEKCFVLAIHKLEVFFLLLMCSDRFGGIHKTSKSWLVEVFMNDDYVSESNFLPEISWELETFRVLSRS